MPQLLIPSGLLLTVPPPDTTTVRVGVWAVNVAVTVLAAVILETVQILGSVAETVQSVQPVKS